MAWTMIALVIRFRTGRWYGRWYGNAHLRVRLFLVLVVGYPFRWQSPKSATKEFLLPSPPSISFFPAKLAWCFLFSFVI